LIDHQYQHDHDHGDGHSHDHNHSRGHAPGPPTTPSGYEPTLVCSHCTADTMLRCIRCKRPYCTDCLERTDAGNICFECLGLPPPAVQRRARAAGQVLRFVAIATTIALVHVFVSIDSPFSNWGVILGIGVGFLIATRLDGIQRDRGMRGAIYLGATSIIQGLLVAVVVIGVLASAGLVVSADGLIPRPSLPETFIDLLLRGFFYYLTAVVTVIAYLWQKSRF
jgi:hypothetical protein